MAKRTRIRTRTRTGLIKSDAAAADGTGHLGGFCATRPQPWMGEDRDGDGDEMEMEMEKVGRLDIIAVGVSSCSREARPWNGGGGLEEKEKRRSRIEVSKRRAMEGIRSGGFGVSMQHRHFSDSQFNGSEVNEREFAALGLGAWSLELAHAGPGFALVLPQSSVLRLINNQPTNQPTIYFRKQNGPRRPGEANIQEGGRRGTKGDEGGRWREEPRFQGPGC
ncbi:hypothetical protein BKA65DRAFT_478944 [Rhexocercosporidium sp. MPI-PUGE-AT-0058]|nr:hypothetical protein BKA65DRAFT_478944 [Rhexocercosporidium sp. MPI-PUGE-AT-0058]